MKLHIQLSDEFGSFCANGEKAAEFRFRTIEPYLQLHEEVVLDFQGIRNMNSSFANALIAPLVGNNPREVVGKLRFQNCTPVVRVLVESAIALGMERSQFGTGCVPA